jgi:hypothetical protein
LSVIDRGACMTTSFRLRGQENATVIFCSLAKALKLCCIVHVCLFFINHLDGRSNGYTNCQD